jgi:hypothetical protein
MDSTGIISLVGRGIPCKEPWTPGAVVQWVENAVNLRGKLRPRRVNASSSSGFLKISIDVGQS